MVQKWQLNLKYKALVSKHIHIINTNLKNKTNTGPDKYPEFKKHLNELLSIESENENENIELPEIIMVLLGDLDLILEFLYMVKKIFE